MVANLVISSTLAGRGLPTATGMVMPLAGPPFPLQVGRLPTPTWLFIPIHNLSACSGGHNAVRRQGMNVPVWVRRLKTGIWHDAERTCLVSTTRQRVCGHPCGSGVSAAGRGFHPLPERFHSLMHGHAADRRNVPVGVCNPHRQGDLRPAKSHAIRLTPVVVSRPRPERSCYVPGCFSRACHA